MVDEKYMEMFWQLAKHTKSDKAKRRLHYLHDGIILVGAEVSDELADFFTLRLQGIADNDVDIWKTGMIKHFHSSNRNVIIIDEFGSYEPQKDFKKLLQVYDKINNAKLVAELNWQREENKSYHDKAPNKDRHFNPMRTHANSHSSKINNRERSRKKRKRRNKK